MVSSNDSIHGMSSSVFFSLLIQREWDASSDRAESYNCCVIPICIHEESAKCYAFPKKHNNKQYLCTQRKQTRPQRTEQTPRNIQRLLKPIPFQAFSHHPLRSHLCLIIYSSLYMLGISNSRRWWEENSHVRRFFLTPHMVKYQR